MSWPGNLIPKELSHEHDELGGPFRRGRPEERHGIRVALAGPRWASPEPIAGGPSSHPEPGRKPEFAQLWRVRLDGETVYAASPASGTPHEVLPWGGLDQVAQMRCADGLVRSEVQQMVFVEVVEDLPADGSAPLTFYYRVVA